MRYYIAASGPTGRPITIEYGRGDTGRKARDKVLYSKGGLSALEKIGLTNPKPLNEQVLVTKTSAFDGTVFQEDEDTPYYLSPSSETYWSA